MNKPKALVFSGYGFNCEEETKYAFELAGGLADIIHINDVIANKHLLKEYQILAFPGGFSYGDDTGSGNAFAQKVRNHLWDEMVQFVEKDSLVIGICNGFQVLVSLGLLPGLNKKYGKKEIALLHNDNATYTVRWVDVQVENKTPWFQNTTPWLMSMETFPIPIAHGEGKFFADPSTMRLLNEKNIIALRYVAGKTAAYQNLVSNPNGSIEDIAGIVDETGKIFGLMPHPERALFMHQLPYYQVLKEKYKREGKKIPQEGPGLQIFKNAVNYFS